MRRFAFAALVLGALSSAEAQSHNLLHNAASDWQAGQMQGFELQGDHLVATSDGARYTSPVLDSPAFDRVLPTWNADTVGGRLEMRVRVQKNGKWSRWFSYGTWQMGAPTSAQEPQKDAFGRMEIDQLLLHSPANAVQYDVQVSKKGASLRAAGLDLWKKSSFTPRPPQRSAAWGKLLDVPQQSQMVFPGGGSVWCSPTSLHMVMAHYGKRNSVRDIASKIHDQNYGGTGNWAFNVAYAAEQGFSSQLARLPDLAAAEKYILKGQPVILSIAWQKGELPGVSLGSSTGHLMVLVGFDEGGNPIVNDPAAPDNRTVRRTYPRAQFERLWQRHSGGVAYLIAPAGL